MAIGAQFTLGCGSGHMGATSLTPCDQRRSVEVGYLTASIKTAGHSASATHCHPGE